MKPTYEIPRVSAKLKRSTTPYSWNGETVYIYKDLENGQVLVSLDPKFDSVFDVLKEYISTTKKSQPPINQFSELRGKENRIYLTLRKVFLDNHPLCEASLPRCTKQATTIHHSQGRIGKRLIDVKTFVPLCGKCHQFCEENPTEAKELGLSLNRL